VREEAVFHKKQRWFITLGSPHPAFIPARNALIETNKGNEGRMV
jgi:hypothetical protein